MTEDEERELRQELLEMDVELRRKQTFWETPRNLAIIGGALVALVAALAGSVGYKLGSQPPIIIQLPAPAQGK